MKKLVLAATLALSLTACGGGGDDEISWRDPDTVEFTFGDREDVTEGSPAEEVAIGGETSAGNLLALTSETDPAAAEQLALSFALSAEALGGFEGEGTALRSAGLEAPETVVWFDPDCVSVTPGAQVVYDNCWMSVSREGETGRFAIDGFFDLDPGHVEWDLTVSMSMSGPVEGGGTGRIEGSNHLTGRIDVSEIDQTIIGFSRVDVYASMSVPGARIEAAVTFNTDYDLEYSTDPVLCITGGTITVKRLPILVPPGAHASDAAVQLTWLGCGLVQVAWPVP